MKIGGNAHLTYCTNIHPGESWRDTFNAIEKYTPLVKGSLAADEFGIGLRLSNQASEDLVEPAKRSEFSAWLQENNMYVYTLNGFPYGSFHDVRVKENVHRPDWLTDDRTAYTKRLAVILADILPENLDGGISTSPVSYRHWHKDVDAAMENSVTRFIDLVEFLIRLEDETGKFIHIDIEPEPDGVLENTEEFVHFYNDHLLLTGTEILRKRGIANGGEKIRRHIQCCYDVCHFAVEFEDGVQVVNRLLSEGIGIGKMQISAALRARIINNKEEVYRALSEFDEDTYLHQAVGKKGSELMKFRDLDILLAEHPMLEEVRSHFHVPVFVDEYGLLESTQDDISKVLDLWKNKPFTNHLEVETYTWQVLPRDLSRELPASIARELEWVRKRIS
ncbi:MAG: metabolite traffic protein EboE [Cyclobacteriaceae bacterium]